MTLFMIDMRCFKVIKMNAMGQCEWKLEAL
jgi:hypothetical protein